MNNSALITELNKQLDYYVEAEDFEKADEISRKLCHVQALQTADKMPADFLFQIKKKEQEKMININMKKVSKRFTRIAVAIAGFLLIGGTASAAVVYRSDVNFFKNGLTDETHGTEAEPQFEGVKLPDIQVTQNIIEQENADASHSWLSKKIWDETSTVYESDDSVNWTPSNVTDRITEYKYDNYSTAAEDAGFTKVFKEDYSGTVYYREQEHLTEASSADYSISGEFNVANGIFTLEQMKFTSDSPVEAAAANNEAIHSENTSVVITNTTGEVTNTRTYISSSGYEYKLTDDKETGNTRTTTLIPCKDYSLILTFTEMTEAEIHGVLENIDIKELIDLTE